MLKNLLSKIPLYLKKYLFVSMGCSLVISIILLLWSFSFSAFAITLFICFFVSVIFGAIEILKNNIISKKINILLSIICVIVTVSSAVIFSVYSDFDKGMSYVFSKEKNISSASQILNEKNFNKNAIINVDSDSFFKTDYKIEKVISLKAEAEKDTSSINDDGWINDIITDRIVLYEYYIVPFDGKYFIAKISPDAFQQIEKQSKKVSLSCHLYAPASSEMDICKSISLNINSILYSMDHFEGEDNKNYYEDLEVSTAESSVVILFETRNLFLDRIVLASSFSVFVIGAVFILFNILFSPESKKIKK